MVVPQNIDFHRLSGCMDQLFVTFSYPHWTLQQRETLKTTQTSAKFALGHQTGVRTGTARPLTSSRRSSKSRPGRWVTNSYQGLHFIAPQADCRRLTVALSRNCTSCLKSANAGQLSAAGLIVTEKCCQFCFHLSTEL